MAKKTENKKSSKTASKKTETAKTEKVSPRTASAVKKADAEATGRRGLWTALIWIGVIGLIAGLSWLSHREPARDTEGARAVSSEIINDFQAGNCAAVYEATTEDFKSRSTEDNWNQQCEIASGVLQGEPEDVETVDNDTSDDFVQFIYRIEGTDEQSYLFTTIMVERDGQWLMDGLSSQVETQTQ